MDNETQPNAQREDPWEARASVRRTLKIMVLLLICLLIFVLLFAFHVL